MENQREDLVVILADYADRMETFVSSNPGFRARIAHRRAQPHFANARSIRNAVDRARLRQADCMFNADNGPLDGAALSMLEESDIRASRVLDPPNQKA